MFVGQKRISEMMVITSMLVRLDKVLSLSEDDVHKAQLLLKQEY